jgi:hypothetical protein
MASVSEHFAGAGGRVALVSGGEFVPEKTFCAFVKFTP